MDKSSDSTLTPFELAKRLVEQKIPRAEALERLRATGLDEEAARVALNAVEGPTPSELPDPTLSPGVNPLSPTSFALSELGLSGNPTTVALYWMAFGAVVLVLITAMLVLPTLGVGETSRAALFWGRVGLGLGGASLLWGFIRLSMAVRIRPRTDNK